MRKIIILVTLIFFYNCKVFSQTDVGYKLDCYDYYSGIIYEHLLSIIDENTINYLVESHTKNNCNIRVYLQLSTDTSFPEYVIIRDACHLLPPEKKEEFEMMLCNLQFDICHNDFWQKEKKTEELYRDGKIIVDTGTFYIWWFQRTKLR